MAEPANGLPVSDRVATLEKGQLELRESIHGIRGTLQLMSRDSDSLGKKLDKLVEQKEANRPRPMTLAQSIALGVTCLTGAAILLGGGVWMISRFTEPVDGRLTALAAQVAERVNSQGAQFSDRLNVFQESIRSIREGENKMASTIADARVSLGRAEDRIAANEKFKEEWTAHDWPGLNAKQSADILANRRDIEAIQREREHERDRLMDKAQR